MPKTIIQFTDFIETVGDSHVEFVNNLNNFLLENNCTTEIKEAANGYVVSYKHKPSKRVVLNYVFRKMGLMLRIYADNISSYPEALKDLPVAMKDAIKKAGPCKRMLNPEDCNSRCPLGYEFDLEGELQQKCRYGLMFYLTDETKPYLEKIVKAEIEARHS